MPKKPEKEKEVKEVNQLKTQFKILTKLFNITSESQVMHVEISKLMECTGILDEKEMMRALFILEGHKLVNPNPAGDFTSRYWGITMEGIKLIKNSSGTKMAA
jgi:uncharacterized protein YqgQ